MIKNETSQLLSSGRQTLARSETHQTNRYDDRAFQIGRRLKLQATGLEPLNSVKYPSGKTFYMDCFCTRSDRVMGGLWSETL